MNSKCRPNGFALPSAIFLLVILAALGTFIVNISTTQHAGSALDVQGERAYQAAYAGMEWVRYRVWDADACPANTTWNASATSLSFAGSQTLGAFEASVECRLAESTDVGAGATTVFEVRVTACSHPHANEPHCPPADPNAGTPKPNANSASLGYVERQLTGLISH